MSFYPVWKTVPFDIADANALQQLAAGQADEDQQKRALKWIVNRAGLLAQSTYVPDEHGGARDSAFADGRQFVAVQTMRLVTTNLEDLKKELNAKGDNNGGSSSSGSSRKRKR